jgi:hypothetical protein
MSFIDKVDGYRGRKAPIQETIRERWFDIEAAVAADKPRAAIRRTLAAEGYAVGKHQSSFNTAYRAVRAEKAAQSARTISTVANNEMGDNRYKSDF